MNRKTYAVSALAVLVIYLASRVTDLDLGGFGTGLLIMAAIFGLMAIVTPGPKGGDNG